MGKSLGIRGLMSNYGLMLCRVVLYGADVLTSLGFCFLTYQKAIVIPALTIFREFWRGSKDIQIIVIVVVGELSICQMER